MQHMRQVFIGSLTILLLGVGCASGSKETIRASANGTSQNSERISCKCGAWAGARGAPTECRRQVLERAHQQEQQQNQTQSQTQNQPATPAS